MESVWTKAALTVLKEAREAVGPETVERLHHKTPWRHFVLAGRQFLLLFACSAALALVKDSRQPGAARKFLDYLAGNEAGAAFTGHGFIVLPASGK